VFTAGKPVISADDVAAVVGVSRQFNIFEFQRAVGVRDIRRSTEILQRMLDAGENATMMIVMMTRYFTLLWKLHSLRGKQPGSQQLAAAAGVHPYYLREYLDAMDHYAPADIETAFLVLAGTDEDLKSTSTDPSVLMHLAMVRILTAGKDVPMRPAQAASAAPGNKSPGDGFNY
jgi:DNA polymerase III delta subunit